MIERYAALDYDALKLSLRELRIGNREVYLEFLKMMLKSNILHLFCMYSCY